MRRCDVPTCWRKHFGQGLCSMHYQRWAKHGEAAIPVRAPIVPLREVRALTRCRTVTSDGCWQWTGGTNGVGYGVTTLRYRRHYVHRLSYTLLVGPIPDGAVIDHLCRNTLCFNPEHLEPVTHAENTQRSPLIGARNECVHGHAFTDENTYVSPAGARSCRTCRRERGRAARARRRAQERTQREGVAACR